MLALIAALALLGGDAFVLSPERAQQYLKNYRLCCLPGKILRNVTVAQSPEVSVPRGGRVFTFQEGPTTPKIPVYARPLWPPVPGQFVLTTSPQKTSVIEPRPSGSHR